MSSFDSGHSQDVPPHRFDDFDDPPHGQDEPRDGEAIDEPDEQDLEPDSPDYGDDPELYSVHSPEAQVPDSRIPRLGTSAIQGSSVDLGQFGDEIQQRHIDAGLNIDEEVMVSPVTGPAYSPDPITDDEDSAVEALSGADEAAEVSGDAEQQIRDLEDGEPSAAVAPDQDAGEQFASVVVSLGAIARLAPHDPPEPHHGATTSTDNIEAATANTVTAGMPLDRDRSSEGYVDEAALAFSRQRTEDAFLRFVETQRERVAAGDFSAFASATRETLFQTFVESPYFATAYDEAVRRTIVSNNEGTLMRSIKGLFFEQLAYAFTAALGADSGDVVLSPAQTFDLVTYANPDQKLQRDRGRLRHYPGVNVPDGLVVSPEGLVTGVLEYTLSTNAEKINPQLEAVATMSPALKALSRDPSFWLAGPHTSLNVVETEVLLPCSHREFNTFFRYAYEVHRVGEDHATLKEMQAYARQIKAAYPELNQRVRQELRLGTPAELDISVVMLDSRGRLKRSDR